MSGLTSFFSSLPAALHAAPARTRPRPPDPCCRSPSANGPGQRHTARPAAALGRPTNPPGPPLAPFTQNPTTPRRFPPISSPVCWTAVPSEQHPDAAATTRTVRSICRCIPGSGPSRETEYLPELSPPCASDLLIRRIFAQAKIVGGPEYTTISGTSDLIRCKLSGIVYQPSRNIRQNSVVIGPAPQGLPRRAEQAHVALRLETCACGRH